VGSRDVEQDNFVSAGDSMRSSQLSRVAGIAQIDELLAFHNAALVHIETGYDSLG
jgi:hypothetical protein